MVRFYLRFTGRVQGVGFRFFVAMNAERCHLTGWVKNMSDGSVTAEVPLAPHKARAPAMRRPCVLNELRNCFFIS